MLKTSVQINNSKGKRDYFSEPIYLFYAGRASCLSVCL